MREFLRGLNLEEDTVDAIMAEYGKNVTRFKERIENYKEKVSSYDDQIKQLNSTIEDNTKNLENLQSMTNENKDLKAQLQMSSSNVRKEFSKFVQNEVMSQVDDEHDFESVLNDYKKENPQYFGEAVTHKVQTSPNLNGGISSPQTTNSIMNEILRNAADE